MAEALIDLGRVEDAPVEPPPPRSWRPVLAAAGALLLVLLGGAAAPVHPPAPAILPGALGDQLIVTDETVFVVGAASESGEAVRSHPLHAYALPGARPVSASTIAVPGVIFSIQPAGPDLLLISARNEADNVVTVIAVRPSTGETLWRRAGITVGVSETAGVAVITTDGVPRSDDEYAVSYWHVVDLETGTSRWSVRLASGEQAVTDGAVREPRRLYVLRTGRLSAYDVRNGRVVAQVPVPGIAPGEAALWPVGDRVLVTGEEGGTYTFQGDELTPVSHVARGMSGYFAPAECDGLLCVYTETNRVAGLDPETGAETWSAPFDGFAAYRDGAVISTATADGTRPRLLKSDPVTGRRLAELDGWSPVPGTASGPFYVQHVQLGADRYWFGVVDPVTFRVAVLFSGEHLAGDCRFTETALVCRRIDASVGVWPLR
ncbi:PQQ-binding-like beta-propeller repeat protein [Actinoplanes sp. NPDC051851]|uniref:outer membrane protein assembly factor BamB family protein n=1 Tax=Actinoplanes sp. NPDC051851 TaxID=3154753 RepID=UPI00341E7A4C